MDISKSISSIREMKGIKQADIAKVLDIEQSNYSRLEKRGNKLTLEQLQNIADALGVTVVHILTYPQAENDEGIDERINKLEYENQELRSELSNAEELTRLHVDLTKMRRDNAKLYYEKYREIKQKFNDSQEPALDLIETMLGVIASLAGIDESVS